MGGLPSLGYFPVKFPNVSHTLLIFLLFMEQFLSVHTCNSEFPQLVETSSKSQWWF